MARRKKRTDWEKEWNLLRKKEENWLQSNRQPKQPLLNGLLEGKVPPKLQGTLEAAFCKAFALVFEKGTPLLERTFAPEQLRQQQQIDQFSAQLRRDRRSLQTFARRSGRAGTLNLALSGVEGVALGALGVGIPDIPLFTGMLLRSLYEMSCHFGFPYDSPEERYFLLKVIEGAMSWGDELDACHREVNRFIQNPTLPRDYRQDQQTARTAQALSRQLLYMKFLQGIPVVGVVGGAYDAICLRRVQQWARLKYQRRLLLSQRSEG